MENRGDCLSGVLLSIWVSTHARSSYQQVTEIDAPLGSVLSVLPRKSPQLHQYVMARQGGRPIEGTGKEAGEVEPCSSRSREELREEG